ncbi:hypothetical protein QQS21_001366 [Conoideocrella luteorostrata]|uniref:Carboxylic ester hydrolase n=1 Tax=Conoideocrella luteorostrata TaxID=1105319 RepID=A0AAJ0CX48_9HYPO|nr:hypothetical protein QQS21_001366 [Conoideocrella luteorostrata]
MLTTTTTTVALAGLVLTAATASATHPPVVKLSAGQVTGGFCSGSGTKLFQGIPFAQPPVGKLRFMPPQELNASYPGGKLDATKPPSPCIQWPSPFVAPDPAPSEDCLFLDVYVPPSANAYSKLPVKVWAYGGANVGGAVTYPLYDACNLATDSIVVSFNYRLSALGFLGLESAGIQGNMALQDYLMALKWVKANIAAFGGDNKKVMLFGQSAGGDGTFVLSTLPQAKSLISAAVMQSGGGLDLVPYETAQIAGASYAEALNCSRTDLACLQSKSIPDLFEASATAPALQNQPLGNVFAMNVPNASTVESLILDGKIIKEEPLKAGSKVPIITGASMSFLIPPKPTPPQITCPTMPIRLIARHRLADSNDGSLFTLPVYGRSPYPVTAHNYTQFLSYFGPSISAKINKQYPLSLFNLTGEESTAVVAAVTHIVTTAGYICQSYKTLRAAMAAGSPAYAYRFNHTLSCPWLVQNGTSIPPPQLKDVFGSAHTAEIPLVFANLDKQPFQQGNCSANSGERELSRTLVAAWTAIAANQSPATPQQAWPRFDKCKSEGIYIQDKAEVAKLDVSECKFWDDIWVELGGARVPGA